jgi:hypothetical protein
MTALHHSRRRLFRYGDSSGNAEDHDRSQSFDLFSVSKTIEPTSLFIKLYVYKSSIPWLIFVSCQVPQVTFSEVIRDHPAMILSHYNFEYCGPYPEESMERGC